MKKTGVFYGSTTGTTESVAAQIAEKLGISNYKLEEMSGDTLYLLCVQFDILLNKK